VALQAEDGHAASQTGEDAENYGYKADELGRQAGRWF